MNFSNNQSGICLLALGGMTRDLYKISLIVKRINPDIVVAADAGYDRLMEMGIYPSLLIGDLDSVKTRYQNHSVELMKYDPEKDQTDAEIALAEVLKRIKNGMYKNISEVYIVFFNGTRLDHVLANQLLLQRYYGEVKIKLIDENNIIEFAKAPYTYETKKQAKYLSILPISDELVMSASGVKYPVNKIRVRRGDTTLVSNEATGFTMVTIHEGEGFIIWSND